MRRETTYNSIYFSADVLREAQQVFRSQIDPQGESEFGYSLEVEIGDDTWTQDSLEEFFADYRKGSRWAYFAVESKKAFSDRMLVAVHGRGNSRSTRISVSASSRSQIEAVFSIFAKHINDSRLPGEPLPLAPLPEKPRIFIGHGRNPLWRELKDHLQDQHNYDVVAYESGARAGHGTRDILEDMIKESSFAILVMTGEDETKDDQLLPRLNVVHELGLFQGRLGFSRSIALLEDETQEFSNIHGVHQIRFSKGNIKETFGDVLATLYREFPERVT